MLAAALLLAATLSVEDYATMPQVSAPHWSPDGKQIAYVVAKADLTKTISTYDQVLAMTTLLASAWRDAGCSVRHSSHLRWFLAAPNSEWRVLLA